MRRSPASIFQTNELERPSFRSEFSLREARRLALSAYSSKTECLTGAGGWSFPGGGDAAAEIRITQGSGSRSNHLST
jgi:hypothetical protein